MLEYMKKNLPKSSLHRVGRAGPESRVAGGLIAKNTIQKEFQAMFDCGNCLKAASTAEANTANDDGG